MLSSPKASRSDRKLGRKSNVADLVRRSVSRQCAVLNSLSPPLQCSRGAAGRVFHRVIAGQTRLAWARTSRSGSWDDGENPAHSPILQQSHHFPSFQCPCLVASCHCGSSGSRSAGRCILLRGHPVDHSKYRAIIAKKRRKRVGLKQASRKGRRVDVARCQIKRNDWPGAGSAKAFFPILAPSHQLYSCTQSHKLETTTLLACCSPDCDIQIPPYFCRSQVRQFCQCLARPTRV